MNNAELLNHYFHLVWYMGLAFSGILGLMFGAWFWWRVVRGRT